MKTKPIYKRLLPLSLIFWGCFFLCNPTVNLFDVLPDAIGYLLLMIALRYASDTFAHFDDALRRFRILFWVSLAKIPAIFAMAYVVGLNMDERGLIAVFALGFAAVEMLFAIPAFRALLDGFTYIGERHGVTTALTGTGGGIDRLTVYTLVFLVCKHALSFLPELVLTSTFFHNGSLEPNAINPIAFYPVLAFLGALTALVLGVVWIAKMHAYIGALRRDRGLHELLTAEYEKRQPAFLRLDERRAQKSFLLLFFLGIVFAIDPTLNNFDILPNVFSAVCFFFALWAGKSEKNVRGIPMLYGIAAVAYAAANGLFFASFKLTDIAYHDAAKSAYTPVLVTSILEGVLFLATVAVLLRALRKFVLTNTGSSLRKSDTALRNEVHASLCKKTKRLGFFALIYAAMRPVCVFLLKLTDRHVITKEEANAFYTEGSVIYTSRFSYLWIVLLIAGVLLAAYTYFLTDEIKNEANLGSDE